MNSTELLAAFRDEMFDTVEPYLWSDAFIYRAIDDAQKMFCRLTEGIEDARTADITVLPIAAGTDWYTLSPLILKPRFAHRADNGRPVRIVGAELCDKLGIQFDGSTGPVTALVTGLEKGAARVWPMPNETVDLNLSVFRLPLEPITDVGDQTLEIDEQHHWHLLDWVKHLAYLKPDPETLNRKTAGEYEQAFRTYCAQARIEQGRVRHPAGAVAYGGL